ncbi:MAG: hypothetical protein R3314_02715 [Longimicrobiales bacterium]|nr:hypothetical protein [Longimicrobiales bacterium]
MERTGNTIGSEGRRQHDEDDPRYGDKPDMEKRIADREAREAEQEGADAVRAEEDSGIADPVPDPDKAGLDDVKDPEGVKPGTVSEIEDAADPDRES